jgi:DNA repair exonuclease SbcCD nuclease subunit
MLLPIKRMKFVHASDLHVDSPLRGLARYEGANVTGVRTATRRALTNLVDLCLEEEAAFLLLAGDIFDGDWKDYGTGLFVASELSRLREANIPVVLIRGNHDAASQITRYLKMPDHVRELSVREPQSLELAHAGVVVHGQGFATRAVRDDLAKVYPRAIAGAFNIGLLHTAVGGREGHENYAPCELSTLVDKRYDYWALGHVHQREILHREPYVVFPGNLQGRHMRELGPKGAMLVTVERGAVHAVEHRALDVVRWELTEVGASGAESAADVLDLVRAELARMHGACPDHLLATRVVVTGPTRANAALRSNVEQYVNEVRLVANDVGGGEIFVENVVFATQSVLDLAKIREQNDAVGHLARGIHAMKSDDAAMRALSEQLADLRQRLPLELTEGEGALGLDERHVREVLADVEQMLLPRLLAGGEDA